MLKQRLLVVIILLPIVMWFIAVGGLPFQLFFVGVLGVSAWEFAQLFRKGGYQPSVILTILGTVALAVERSLSAFQHADVVLTSIILVAATYHLIRYEKGRDQAPVDFAITMAGIIYLGWLGSYLISIRDLPNGQWWFLLALPVAWLGDSGAFLVGSRFGKHKLAPRLSPKKTWEGYWGGVITAILAGIAFAALWGIRFPELTLARGALVGLIMGVITPLGDFAESMFKRMVNAKDSSGILPGHGGFFDRIDSWIWAAVLGYYLVTTFWL